MWQLLPCLFVTKNGTAAKELNLLFTLLLLEASLFSFVWERNVESLIFRHFFSFTTKANIFSFSFVYSECILNAHTHIFNACLGIIGEILLFELNGKKCLNYFCIQMHFHLRTSSWCKKEFHYSFKFSLCVCTWYLWPTLLLYFYGLASAPLSTSLVCQVCQVPILVRFQCIVFKLNIFVHFIPNGF